MSFGRTSSNQESGLDPQIRDAYLSNLGRSSNIAGDLRARQFAGFTPDEQTAAFNLRQVASPTSLGMNQVFRGGEGLIQEQGFQPSMVSGQNLNAQTYGGATIDPAALARAEQAARGSVRDVSSMTGAGGMAAYQNPFEEQVVQSALQDIERSRQMQQMQGSARAAAAGAFGGSRQGVTEALTNEAALREAGRTSAGLRSQGFEFAAGMGQTDAARQLQSQMSNQGVDMSIEQANAALRQQTGLSNQQAINARAMEQAGLTQQAGLASMQAANAASMRQAEMAQQANLANQAAGLEGSRMRTAASRQLSDVGAMTQNLGFTSAQQLQEQGMRERGFTQAQMDAIRNLPLEQQAIINESLGLQPAGGAGTVSSGQTSGFNLGLTK